MKIKNKKKKLHAKNHNYCSTENWMQKLLMHFVEHQKKFINFTSKLCNKKNMNKNHTINIFGQKQNCNSYYYNGKWCE
jgi:hypothetical protein